MNNPKKPAMAECQGCHYRFPKPDMKQDLIQVGGGYSPPRTTTKLDKNLQPTGYSKSQGTYRQGREKTLWFCSECYEKRKANQKQGCLNGIVLTVALLFALIVYSAVNFGRPNGAAVNNALEEQPLALGSQIQDTDRSPQTQTAEAPIDKDNIGAGESEALAQSDRTAVEDTAIGLEVPGIATMSSPNGVRTSNVIALRAAVAAAVTTGQSQTWSHYMGSGSVVVQGADPSSQCPIIYFTVDDEGWRSAAVPVCASQSIVD